MPDPQQSGLSAASTQQSTLSNSPCDRAKSHSRPKYSPPKRYQLVEKSSSEGFSNSSDSRDSFCGSSRRNDKEDWNGPSRSSESDSSDKTTDSEKATESETRAILSNLFSRLSLIRVARSKKDTAKTKQKSILRKPTCHIHVRGLSGLPTQRIPVSRDYYKLPHRYHRLPSSISSSAENALKVSNET